MILNSIDTQFKISDAGGIFWQRDLTDPRVGSMVAQIKKGTSILAPTCDIVESGSIAGEDKEVVQKFIEAWLQRHVQNILAPLFKLKEEDIAQGAPYDIAQKLYDALGILPREELQDLIGAMDEEGRNTLRSKKIRFGPIIVYLPELNKPAMVRLRAQLLSVWQDKPLPAEAPNDGIVSFVVTDKNLDADYYRAIGYPIYGPRSIRVDMLDRLICRVYDSAVAGKFKAEHQMAEWLGTSIPDLYAVLEAMGHKKIHDPADEKLEEPNEEKLEEPKPQVKPELATFILKSSKISKPKVETFKKKKPFKKKVEKPKHKSESRQKIYTAEAKNNPEDNPFAILQQLKSSKKE